MQWQMRQLPFCPWHSSKQESRWPQAPMCGADVADAATERFGRRAVCTPLRPLHLRRSSPLTSGCSISSMIASTRRCSLTSTSERLGPHISAYHLIFGSAHRGARTGRWDGSVELGAPTHEEALARPERRTLVWQAGRAGTASVLSLVGSGGLASARFGYSTTCPAAA